MRIESYGSVKVYWPDFTRDELIAELRQRVPGLAADLPLRRAKLFGSWAADEATAFSDVDVLIVYSGPPRPDAYKLVLEHLHVEGLEPHVYAEDEAARIWDTLQGMIRNGVDLLEVGS